MKSLSQKIILTAALTSVSYDTLHRVWAPMDMREIQRIINKAMFFALSSRVG